MKNIILAFCISLFVMPYTFAMEEEKEEENIPMVETTEEIEQSDTPAKVAWYKKAFNLIRKNKAKTAVVTGLAITTGGGFASDIATQFYAPPTYSFSFIALPGNGTLPHNIENCSYIVQTDCNLSVPLENFEQCEEYLGESGEIYLQACYWENDGYQTYKTGYGSMVSRAFMIVAASVGWRVILWKFLPWKK